ncbi:excalibur calcium-binding domain-containing protein [Neobacillus jeddahensis]|uniref:excalibur calcium-binding domain-containing protein n=1 Tax=Neobacillus jeddahensis TaxID=1461580 RepID=UPI000694FFC8|nr:excalibur calcium-binding domain-containing protein [Neobacillus jeddahensis]
MALYFGWMGFVIMAYFLVSGINGLRKRNPRAKLNFLWMLIGLIIWLITSGNSFIMILFAFGFLAFIFFLIAGILALIKRNGKAKKRFLLMLGALVIWLGSAAMLPNDKKETNIQASEAKIKSKEDTKEKAAALAKEKKEAEEKAKEEAEQKAKAEAELKAKEEAEAQAKAEAELKAKEEAEAQAKAEAEAKAKAEAQAKAEAEAQAIAEAETKAKAEAQAKAQQQKATSSSTTGQTSFANCTELRKVYPNGVSSDHPAYTTKMDRDHDNVACERY